MLIFSTIGLSLEELNAAIRKCVVELNAKIMRKLRFVARLAHACRQHRLASESLSAMRRIPHDGFASTAIQVLFADNHDRKNQEENEDRSR
jgi:hypothetical protein